MSSVHVIVTGGFDPIHSGHIAYLESAKTLGNKLWVGLNSDDWLCRKKGKFFMELTERKKIISTFNKIGPCFFL
jgi:cytidyltransferase-related domain